MRKRITVGLAISIIGLLAVEPMSAQFGLSSIPQLLELIAQGKKLYSLTDEVRQQGEKIARFVKNPSEWRGGLERAVNNLEARSNGADQAALQKLKDAINASQKAHATWKLGEADTNSILTSTLVALQQVEMQQRADTLKVELDYIDTANQLKQSGIGRFGCVSCSF